MGNALTSEVTREDTELIADYLKLFPNESDFSAWHMRKAVQYVYPLFIFLYAMVVAIGAICNVCVIVTVVRYRLYAEPVMYFMCNLAVSDIIKCVIVLPITLNNLLLLDWIFGSFMCYFMPMLHYIPIYASTMTFVLIAVYRYRLIFYPLSSQIPRFLSCLGVWILSVCVVLPFSIYMKYVDLGHVFRTLGVLPDEHVRQLEGIGLCAVNVHDNMAEYLRGLFIALYVLPLAVIAFLFVRISGEIKVREYPLPSVIFDAVSTDDHSRSTLQSGYDTPCPTRSSWMENEATTTETQSIAHKDPETVVSDGGLPLLKHHSYDSSIQWRPEVAEESGFDPRKEKRTQKYLITMVSLFAICLGPLEIIKLVKHSVLETFDNTGHYDLAFLIVVWIGFLPTCVTPILFASWFSPQPMKDKLRGYLQLSNRGRCSSAAIANHTTHRTSSTVTGGHSNEAYAPNGGKLGNAHNLTASHDLDVTKHGQHHHLSKPVA